MPKKSKKNSLPSTTGLADPASNLAEILSLIQAIEKDVDDFKKKSDLLKQNLSQAIDGAKLKKIRSFIAQNFKR